MKVTVKQLAKMLMEDKHVLATHPGAEENPDGIEKDLLSRSWGDDEEADPKLDYVDEARFAELAGIINEAADPKIESVAGIVRTEVDSGKGDIFTMADKLQASGLPAEYMSGMGMRYVQIPHKRGHIVVISKNSIQPDSETVIVGPYAIGYMGEG